MKACTVAWNETKDVSYQINYNEESEQTSVLIKIHPIPVKNSYKMYMTFSLAPKDVDGHTVLVTSFWEDATLITLGNWELVDALKWVEGRTGYKHLEYEFWKDQTPEKEKSFKTFTVTWNGPEESD